MDIHNLAFVIDTAPDSTGVGTDSTGCILHARCLLDLDSILCDLYGDLLTLGFLPSVVKLRVSQRDVDHLSWYCFIHLRHPNLIFTIESFQNNATHWFAYTHCQVLAERSSWTYAYLLRDNENNLIGRLYRCILHLFL